MPGQNHIVLVDDNPDILETYSELLESAGYEVTSCATGLSALLRIGSDRPDLVILDLKLTDVSGFDLYRTLRADPSFAALPVLFVSGVFLDEAMLRDRVEDPTARLLLKPIPQETLIEEVQRAIQKPALPGIAA